MGPSESGWFRMDAEAINAFGGDLRSVLVRIADSPAEVSIDAASFRALPAPLAVPLGESSSGTALAVADPALSLAFVVRAKGDPQPTVTVYDARTGDPVSAIDTPVTNATASVLGQSVVVTSRQLAVANSGNYLVVVGNALGKAVTNLVSVGIFPEITTPAVSSAVSPNPTVPSLLGPVAAGSTNVVFSVISAHGPSVTYQWLKDGSEIARATNGTLALTNFSFVQIGSYSVRVSNPLTGSSLPADRSRGTAVSGGFTPVLAATVALSRTNILAPSGTAASLEIQLAGSLAGRVQLQRWDDVLGSWRDASATFPVTVPPLPAVWAPGGFFDLDLTGGGGRASFSVGTSALQPSMTGIYRVRAVQLTVPGGVELAGTEQIVSFPVTVNSA
ncbi:MAG: immunoglobulin domain-containing protein, partial [Verrucomicrobiota bacterium]